MSKEQAEDLRLCLARLAELKAEFGAILAIFGEDIFLTGERKVLAQEGLKALKAKLGEEVGVDEEELSQAERSCYSRGVRQARGSIKVRYNSRPDQKWIDQLSTGRSSLALAASRAEQALHKLEGKRK
ncbi:MAG TPA: hypothetical protein VLT87_06565 [Thermoanaerobaculia bacterium]|nr:hypothetical protein [Thermoanaerobaculia bacterium]